MSFFKKQIDLMTDSGGKWYVVRVISGKENRVKTHIEDEVKYASLNDYLGQILIPTEKVYQIKSGKKVSRERNYIPGYIMIEANLIGELIYTIKKINGVLGFLGTGKDGDPVPLRQNEVNRLLGKFDELSEAEEQINIPFVVGEAIKVIGGPFNGFNGTIEKINEEKRKLGVVVKIFGRKTPLELSYMQVEKE